MAVFSRGEVEAAYRRTIDEWLAIDGNRVVYKWLNRLPGKRADGTHYEFPGITIKLYAGGGRFDYQEDVYNWESALTVLKEFAAAQRTSP